MKKVIDEFGEERCVNEEKRRLYSYSNKNRKVTWNAPIIQDGEEIGQWVNYTENGTIEDIRLRLETWNNMVKLMYANSVEFKASENDPDREIWNKIVETIEAHPEDCFDEYGDFKKNMCISEDDIRKMAKELN